MADLSFLLGSKPIAILGLGVSGQAVANACAQAGIAYHGWVDDPQAPPTLQSDFNIHDFSNDLSSYEMLVPAAGIKPSHPIIQAAKAQNIPMHSDVDLLLRSAPDARVIAVTGTNGKSTVTALIGHILQHAGINVAMGGNIGRAACSLPSLDASGVYVLEMSSYMLDISSDPVADIAVLLNIRPDHLDWHGTFEHYSAAKMKILRQRTNHPPITIIKGLSLQPDQSIPDFPEHAFLKGQHNLENRLAAFLACRAVGVSEDVIIKHMTTFTGLKHRQNHVAQYKNVTFINDSKATNADATSHALAAYKGIYWIAGGQPKSDGIDGLEKFYSNIRKAFLIGEAADAFADKLNGHVPVAICHTMDKAVQQAFAEALHDGRETVILLSPACASFDQYQNFEQRGDDFTQCVQTLLAQQEKTA